MKRLLETVKKISARFHARRPAGFIALVLAVVLVFCAHGVNSYTESVNDGFADSIIRLHVIANSDSAEDQELKRNVRDAVLACVRELVEESGNIKETESIIKENISGISAAARKTVLDSGMDYAVKTEFGKYPFPTKAYGDIILPPGAYKALRVVIGKGEGSNWWCVLFPPLCFVDVTHGIVPDSAKEELREVLSDEEYRIVTSSDDESDIPVKIKFKIVEMFQDSKIRLAGAFEKLFKPES
ncbi:MAG: stage II sporulation protein R [Acetivibrionales bacterium]|jgi:stage II sporulation protein R